MPFRSTAIANRLFDIASGLSGSIDPLKVQKLVYFAHGWHLAITGQPLLKERVEAWKYGPVVPELYHALKERGRTSGTEHVSVLEFEPSTTRVRIFEPSVDAEAADDKERTFVDQLLKRVWEVYGKYSGTVLSNATHAPGSPWEITWKQSQGARHAVILDELIKADFLKRAQANAEHRTETTA